MEEEYLTSLMNNISNEKRLNELISIIEDRITHKQFINYITKKYNKTYNIFSLIQFYKMDYSLYQADNLFKLYIDTNKYDNPIKKWFIFPETTTIFGYLNNFEIITSPIKTIFFIIKKYNNYFDKYNIDSKLAIQTMNNLYFLDDQNIINIKNYDPMNISFIMSLEEIEQKTKIPLVLLAKIYTYFNKYELVVI